MPTPCRQADAGMPPRRPHAHGGWLIQIGAFDDEDDAKQHLSAAQDQAARRARRRRPVHRARPEGRQGALSRPLRRLRQGDRGSRLQATQAQRLRMHGGEGLKIPRDQRERQGSVSCEFGQGAASCNGREATRGLYGVPQRWRRRRTSLASLTRAARYVVPPWSGCSFFMRERWARVMSSALAPG